MLIQSRGDSATPDVEEDKVEKPAQKKKPLTLAQKKKLKEEQARQKAEEEKKAQADRLAAEIEKNLEIKGPEFIFLLYTCRNYGNHRSLNYVQAKVCSYHL